MSWWRGMKETLQKISEATGRAHLFQGINARIARYLRFWCVGLLAMFGGLFSILAQNFSVTSTILSNGAVQVAFPGRADSYYLLSSTSTLSRPSQPVSALL